MSINMLLRSITAVVAMSLLAIVGCGSPAKAKGTIVGKVVYKGAPVSAGEVEIFFKEAGEGATALLDETGGFTISTPLSAGIYTVSVNPPPVIPNPEAPSVKPKAYPNIPLKARDMKTSGLTIPLNAGENSVTLELKD